MGGRVELKGHLVILLQKCNAPCHARKKSFWAYWLLLRLGSKCFHKDHQRARRQPVLFRLACLSAGTQDRACMQQLITESRCSAGSISAAAKLPRSSAHKRQHFFLSQVSDRWCEKREGWGAEGGRTTKRKRRVHKEVASCLTWKQKRGHSEQNEGPDWSAITLPDDQPPFDVDWLPGVRRGRKSYSVCDPCRPRGERHTTWAPWMRPASITHAIHPCQASDNRCRFLSAPS